MLSRISTQSDTDWWAAAFAFSAETNRTEARAPTRPASSAVVVDGIEDQKGGWTPKLNNVTRITVMVSARRPKIAIVCSPLGTAPEAPRQRQTVGHCPLIVKAPAVVRKR